MNFAQFNSQVEKLKSIVGDRVRLTDAEARRLLGECRGDLDRAVDRVYTEPRFGFVNAAPKREKRKLDPGHGDSVSSKVSKTATEIVGGFDVKTGDGVIDLIDSSDEEPAKNIKDSCNILSHSESIETVAPEIKPWSVWVGAFVVRGTCTSRFRQQDAPVYRTAIQLAAQNRTKSASSSRRAGDKFSFKNSENNLSNTKQNITDVSVRCFLNGRDLGRFPNDWNRILGPLMLLKVVDVEASIGPDPPDILEPGVSFPILVEISVPNSAFDSDHLKALTEDDENYSALIRNCWRSVFKESGLKIVANFDISGGEENIENGVGIGGVECISLDSPEKIVGAKTNPNVSIVNDDVSNSTENSTNCLNQNEKNEADIDIDVDQQNETTQNENSEAMNSVSSDDSLAGKFLMGIQPPETVFNAKLWKYQQQALYWMWRREHPDASVVESWVSHRGDNLVENGDDEKKSKSENKSNVIQNGEDADVDKRALHPLWEQVDFPKAFVPPGAQKEMKCFYFHRGRGLLSLVFPEDTPDCFGGILADEMGLGKTVMACSLLALDATPECRRLPLAPIHNLECEKRGDKSDVPGAVSKSRNENLNNKGGKFNASKVGQSKNVNSIVSFLKPKNKLKNMTNNTIKSSVKNTANRRLPGTLVVLPLSLLHQWQSEIESHIAKNLLSVYEFHGNKRDANNLSQFDIVLTTYGTLSSEPADSQLFSLVWHRIMLDEAHLIKGKITKVAKAAYSLQARHRWCLSGTPMQNSLEDLFPLLKWLQCEPWGIAWFWKKLVSEPMAGGDQEKALNAVRRVGKTLMLRRTKRTTDSEGKLLIELPPKHTHIVRLQLSAAERDFYTSLFTKSQTTLSTFVKKGTMFKNFTHVFQLICKLRQALCHPYLVHKNSGLSDQNLTHMLENAVICNYCNEPAEEPVLTPCQHILCRECCLQHVAKVNADVCVICNSDGVNANTIIPYENKIKTEAEINNNKDFSPSFEPSAKMIALLSHIKEDIDNNRKAVVFSQWTSFFDLIQKMFDAEKVPYRRLDGSMSVSERRSVVAWLAADEDEKNNEKTKSDKLVLNSTRSKVLLVSLRAGGVGLNMVAACRVYFMDLWWNPAVEAQAEQRCHRIGQKNDVHVFKFVADDSMDERILQLQKGKEFLVSDALTLSAKNNNNEEDQKKLRFQDIAFLFKLKI
eukprot:gene105-623_t